MEKHLFSQPAAARHSGRFDFEGEYLHPSCSERHPYFTERSLGYSLWIHQVSGDGSEPITPDNLSTIVPFGAHELYVIDGIGPRLTHCLMQDYHRLRR